LASGEEVSIINFGTFYSNYSVKNNIGKRIKENVASTIQVFILKFRVSHNLKERLNGKKTK
jgi:nucleoid DNA-binding protein